MTWSFIEHITNHLTKPKLGEQKQPTLWPSGATAIVNNELVGKCRRQNFFRYAKDNYNFSEKYDYLKNINTLIKENFIPPSVYSQWIWRAGELYEQYCIDVAKESGVYIADQVSIYIPDFNVSGKIDLVVVNPDLNKYQIVEVKSIYGFNANSILGTDSQRRSGIMGTPRESHLMQLGIYQSWYGNTNENFGPAMLVYGSRDTGKYGEFLVTVEQSEEDNKHYIWYQPNAPVAGSKVNSGITIESILLNYKNIQECIDNNIIPDRDYDLLYSEDKLAKLYSEGLLNKTETAQFEKRKLQIEEGKEKLVKQVEKGDWQCRLCEYKDVCYDSSSRPKQL